MTPKKRWELRYPRPIHLKLAELAAQGLSRRECAAQTGLSVWQISRIVNSPLFAAMVAQARQIQAEAAARATLPMEERVDQTGIEALNTLRQLSSFAGSSHAQLKACMTLLRLGEKRQPARKADRPRILADCGEIRLILPDLRNIA